MQGKRIAVYAEQGLGDVIQFIRYVRELQADGATVDLLSPGMHVVIVTVTDSPNHHSADPAVLAKDAVVLSVGAATSPGGAAGRIVVVGVPTVEADRLAAAALGSDLAIRFG